VSKKEQKAPESTVVAESQPKAPEPTAVGEREQLALRTVRKYMWWSMGAGLIPVPFVDWGAVSGVQVKMVADVSKVYGVPFSENCGKAVIGSLLGFVLPHVMACGMLGSLLKAIPVVGVLAGAPAMAIYCGAAEWALGKTFIQHFESGGTFLDFKPEEVREYFKSQFEEGQRMAATLGTHQKIEEKGEAPA